MLRVPCIRAEILSLLLPFGFYFPFLFVPSPRIAENREIHFATFFPLLSSRLSQIERKKGRKSSKLLSCSEIYISLSLSRFFRRDQGFSLIFTISTPAENSPVFPPSFFPHPSNFYNYVYDVGNVESFDTDAAAFLLSLSLTCRLDPSKLRAFFPRGLVSPGIGLIG